MDDRQFLGLLEFLGLSWQGYRKVRKGVKKRVASHMQTLGCCSMAEYLERLERQEEIRKQCEQRMGVSISRFYRDRRLWEVLEGKILPELLETCGGRMRVWSAGCGCGEEVYSLRILWEHMGRSHKSLPVLNITAADVNPLYIEKAQYALYPSSSLREVPEDLRAACFEAQPGGKRFMVKPYLREDIAWRTHDFFSGAPGLGFHLIFLRNNLLTYYQDQRIGPVLVHILNALAVGGYLVVGSHEKLAFQSAGFAACPCLPYAFKKHG